MEETRLSPEALFKLLYHPNMTRALAVEALTDEPDETFI